VERYFGWLLVAARLPLAVVFLLNGFGVIDQTIPAREMLERGVPAGIVPLAMFVGRTLEIVTGFGLAFGIFPRWCVLLEPRNQPSLLPRNTVRSDNSNPLRQRTRSTCSG